MPTRTPAPEIAHVHDRMPAVLARDDERRWLDPALRFNKARDVFANKIDRYRAEPLEEMPPIKPIQADLFY